MTWLAGAFSLLPVLGMAAKTFFTFILHPSRGSRTFIASVAASKGRSSWRKTASTVCSS